MLARLIFVASTALAGPVSVSGGLAALSSASSVSSVSSSSPVDPPPLVNYTNFSASCESVVLYATHNTGNASHRLPDQLKARCRDYAGVLHATSIDLNLCVGIDYDDAALVWSIYGKFSEYCSRCWSAGTRVEMGCACALLAATNSPLPMTTNSTIDLDAGIGNVNGTLRCTGGTGSRGD